MWRVEEIGVEMMMMLLDGVGVMKRAWRSRRGVGGLG